MTTFAPKAVAPIGSKARFFRDLAAFKQDHRDGFYLKRNQHLEMWGRIEGNIYWLMVWPEEDRAVFANEAIRVQLRYSDAVIQASQPLIAAAGARLDLEKFLRMRTILRGIDSVSFTRGLFFDQSPI